ncbi:Probable L,D-transpeptidase YbiS precursor [Raoultella terrigena]|uniref:Probable L,D-transpeptidase YbiS n=1 Tax=Raoultella terrigena TaxID=577 RepID=A0A4U9DBS7_RAOTE|nr:Probable L,D-transpeptidase YbiS precursor [Raoultella terrigena]
MGLYALYIGRLYAIPRHQRQLRYRACASATAACVCATTISNFLFENVPVGTRVEFIDEPVKATSEPDGSRYVEVHNPLSTTEAQFQGGEIVPITPEQIRAGRHRQSDVDQSVVEQAVQNRSGMPVRLN